MLKIRQGTMQQIFSENKDEENNFDFTEKCDRITAERNPELHRRL